MYNYCHIKTYPGVILDEDNNHQIDLQERIKNANKTYFMPQKVFGNKNISKKIKLRLKSTIIDKMLTCASETWILTERDRKQVNIFEKKVYRRILGPVYDKTLTPFYWHGQERVELYLYSPYGPYGLYRTSVPVQGCTLPFSHYCVSMGNDIALLCVMYLSILYV